MIYIYTLKDPFTGLIRYVGKTKRLRERLANQCNDRSNNYRCHWIQQVISQGSKPIQEILETLLDDADWQSRERYWIARGRELGWPLVNGTSGGDGVPDLTGEAKQRQLATWKGRKHTPDSIAKIGRASRGRRHTDEYKEMMRQKMSAREFGEQHRQRIGAARSRLTPGQVREVRKLLSEGVFQRDIAQLFGVTQGVITGINRNTSKYYQSIK